MKCPKCKSESHVRNVLIKGRQRFKCRGCGCNCTAGYGQVLEKEKKRRFGLSIYLEGLGFHSTGRLLEVSHVTVMNRVRGYGSEPGSIRNSKPVCIMELDEMHSYAGRKKTASGFGLLLTGKQENTLISLWETEVQPRDGNYGKKSGEVQPEQLHRIIGYLTMSLSRKNSRFKLKLKPVQWKAIMDKFDIFLPGSGERQNVIQKVWR